MNDIFAKDLSGEMVSPDEPGYDELITDIFATIINVEWRQNGGGCIQFFVKNKFHIFMHLFMRTITRVHLGRSLYGSENVRNQFIITRFIR